MEGCDSMFGFNWKRKEADKMVENIKELFTTIMDENDELKKELREYNKDEEIQKMEKKLSEVLKASVYQMTDIERKSAADFSSLHYKRCKGVTLYIVKGTGIGDVLVVQCDKCKEHKDITDISTW